MEGSGSTKLDTIDVETPSTDLSYASSNLTSASHGKKVVFDFQEATG